MSLTKTQLNFHVPLKGKVGTEEKDFGFITFNIERIKVFSTSFNK